MLRRPRPTPSAPLASAESGERRSAPFPPASTWQRSSTAIRRRSSAYAPGSSRAHSPAMMTSVVPRTYDLGMSALGVAPAYGTVVRRRLIAAAFVVLLVVGTHFSSLRQPG